MKNKISLNRSRGKPKFHHPIYRLFGLLLLLLGAAYAHAALDWRVANYPTQIFPYNTALLYTGAYAALDYACLQNDGQATGTYSRNIQLNENFPAKQGGWCLVNTFLGQVPGAYYVAELYCNGQLRTDIFDDSPCPDVPLPPNPKNNGNQCSAMVGDPVNTFTGNSYQPQTDYADSGIGKLTFTRAYNSLDSQAYPLGVAWLSNYHRSLSISATAVKLLGADGKVYPYAGSGGIWTGDPDVKERLEQIATGWRYTTRNDTVEEYDSSGRLVNITDVSGYVQSLFYNASNQLEYVEDSLGRRISFTYNPQGRVEYFYDPMLRPYHYTYDTNNNLASVQYPDGTAKQYLYEDPRFPHALTGSIDQNTIRYVTWQYDASGRIMANYRSNNANRVDLAYNPDGTTTVTNSRNVASTYSFINQFGLGLVSNISGPGCSTCGSGDSSYQYDPANSNLLSKTIKGLTTTYANYDSKGNAQTITEAAGTPKARTTSYTYDPRFYSMVATKTEPSVCATGSKVTTYGHDNFGNTTSITINGYKPDCTPVSRSTTLQYNGPLNQLSQIDGPRIDLNDVTTFDYYPNDAAQGNNRGRLQRVTLANGVLARDNLQYSATGKVVSEQRPNGVTLTYTYYPGNDRLQTLTRSDGSTYRTTFWTYFPSGEVETITQGYGTADAVTLTFDYDDARRLTDIVEAQGNYIEYVLDTEGNKQEENIHDQNGVLLKHLAQTFDAYNQLATFAQANETRTTHFSPDGTLHDTLDGKNVASVYQYDELKRLLTNTADVGGTDPATQDALTQYGYNVHDNLTSVTDPINGNTNFVYDDLGNLLTLTSPDTGTTVYTYDAAGNLQTRRDAKGQLFNYYYDALNRVTIIAAPDTSQNITSSYDTCPNGAGRLCSITQGSDTVAYQYNAYGDITQHQGVTYTYNARGELATITSLSGIQLRYQYDNVGRVSAVQQYRNGVWTDLASNLGYAPFGPLKQLTYANAAALSRQFDQAYRLTSQSVPGIYQRSYPLYDANGNLQTITDTLTLQSDGYAYDALARLTDANSPAFAQTLGYDKNGNRTDAVSNGVTTTYAYTANTNRLSTINATAIALDPNGNTFNDGRHAYTYDNFNRLLSVDATTTYTYNALGQRIGKTVNAKATGFVYDLQGRLIAELDPQGLPAAEYVYVNGEPLAIYRTSYPDAFTQALSLGTLSGSYTLNTTTATRETGEPVHAGVGAGYSEWVTFTATQTGTLTLTTTGSNFNTVIAVYTGSALNALTEVGHASNGLLSLSVTAGTTYHIAIDGTATSPYGIAVLNWQFTGPDTAYIDNDIPFLPPWALATLALTLMGLGVRYGNFTHLRMMVLLGGTMTLGLLLLPVGTHTAPVPAPALVPGIWYYIHTDHLGTPRSMTDANQKVIWRWDSDPFGAGAANDDPDADGTRVTLNLRFPGQYFDAESMLHYNYHRYYDPQTGRYITTDPIGLEGGLNTYGYVGGNPLRYIDPYGLQGLPYMSCYTTVDCECKNPTAKSQRNCRDAGGYPLFPDMINENGQDGTESKCPPLPDDLVGTNSRDSSGKRKNTDPPNTNETPEELFDKLTGGTGKRSDPENPDHIIGDNGIRYRPGEGGKGPRIDIPGNDTKPPETIHF